MFYPKFVAQKNDGCKPDTANVANRPPKMQEFDELPFLTNEKGRSCPLTNDEKWILEK